jgi:hypothetical protein
MLEKHLERKLVTEVKKMGGLALKLISPGFYGVPDRLVLLSQGKMAFVEVKAPGKTLRPLQEKRKRQLESLGFLVFCLDNVKQIEPLLAEIMGGDAK